MKLLQTLLAPARTPLHANVDWRALINAAERHDVFPQLAKALTTSRQNLPKDFPAKSIGEALVRQAAENLAGLGELQKILTALTKAGVSALIYKGPVLAHLAYGDLSARRYADLDILIPEAKIQDALEVMAGFELNSTIPVPADRLEDYARYHYEFTLSRLSDQRLVEIKWRLCAAHVPGNVSFESFYERRIEANVSGFVLPTISHEDLIYVLVHHGSKHLWQELRYVLDLDRFIRSQLVDWSKVQTVADRAGGLKMLALGLHLASEVCQTPVPDKVLLSLPLNPQLKKLSNQAKENLEGAAHPHASVWDHVRFQTQFHQSFLAGAKSILQLAVRPSVGDWRLVNLPRPLSWGYFFIRPIRLLVDRPARLFAYNLRRAKDYFRYYFLPVYGPTSPWIVDAMLRLAEVEPDDVVVDLGAGDGRVVIAAAQKFGAQGLGIDIDPYWTPVAQQAAEQAGVSDKVKFVCDDALSADYSDASVVVLFMTKYWNTRIRDRLGKLNANTRIVCHMDEIPGVSPEKTEMVIDRFGRAYDIFLYRAGQFQ